ncbi:uncharacterized protein [Diabrotica undecimpunctata]|uniref:uncharacterized protein n=1 Tax=Diabrotica undecimpunctata TaxID=50387 RepID=UPI003B632B44
MIIIKQEFGIISRSKSNVLCPLNQSIFSKVLLEGKIEGKAGQPDALNTVFGYILLGPTSTPNLSSTSLVCLSNIEDPLDSSLTKFWELENVPEKPVSEPEDVLCENIYLETHNRDVSGKYVVSLPFRESPPCLQDSYDIALNRLLSLERRLSRQPSLKKEYSFHMQEYLDLGHMQLVSNAEKKRGKYYIPHHCVVKPDSVSSKIRVVYNASQKSPSRGKSLNDYLLVGPKLQQNIVSLLLNFRLNRFALCADIRQMYRNILVAPEHTDYQRVLWRFSSAEEIQEYRLLTVTFGIVSSPYLALRTLQQLALDEGSRFPKAVSLIRHASYIDDFVFGASTLEEAQTLVDELVALLKLGGFELRKWCSNEPKLLSQFPESHINPHSINFDPEANGPSLKILGLKWIAQSDVFQFSVKLQDVPCTKRSFLSELARIYDPCGYLTPITFFIKHLIQQLWATGLKWDDRPPSEIIRVWEQYKSELSLISQFKIPRFLNNSSCPILELHGFADASEKGYACVVYIRSIDTRNLVQVNLLCAKSKVAPIKQITIPRLELLAAVHLVKLMSFVLESWKHIIFQNVYAWLDSQIVLHWIKSSHSRFKTFVANRISYIQSHSQNYSWHYIESRNNAVDAPSRGMLPAAFLSKLDWLTGPSFLYNIPLIFPEVPPSLQEKSSLEEIKKALVFVSTREEHFLSCLLKNKSSFTSIQRILAFMLRFAHNSRYKRSKRSGPLTFVELEDSLIILVRFTQEKYFEEHLQSNSFPKPFRKLGVFLDDSTQCLRVGGRLSQSSLSYEAKHPFLLPKKSRLTTLLVSHYHEKYLHAGFKSTQFLVSQRFWIMSSKQAINSVLSKCIRCWKQSPKNLQPPMGNLPKFRLGAIKPFSICGLDYGGPFSITMSRYRGVRTQKAYLCLFVCCGTKALNLELASDLTAEAFLAALQRFY